MTVVLSKLAQSEVRQAAIYYESRKEGLGEEFKERVLEAVELIETNPRGYREIYRGLRRVGLRQFKDWGLLFKIREDDSLVVACLSGKRDYRLVKERASGVIPMPKPEP